MPPWHFTFSFPMTHGARGAGSKWLHSTRWLAWLFSNTYIYIYNRGGNYAHKEEKWLFGLVSWRIFLTAKKESLSWNSNLVFSRWYVFEWRHREREMTERAAGRRFHKHLFLYLACVNNALAPKQRLLDAFELCLFAWAGGCLCTCQLISSRLCA